MGTPRTVKTPDIRKLFEALDSIRLLADKTIDDVALLCGVTPKTYKKWRSGGSIRPQRYKQLYIVAYELKEEYLIRDARIKEILKKGSL